MTSEQTLAAELLDKNATYLESESINFVWYHDPDYEDVTNPLSLCGMAEAHNIPMKKLIEAPDLYFEWGPESDLSTWFDRKISVDMSTEEFVIKVMGGDND